MTPYRSTMADYLTITTGLFTLLSGLYSIQFGGWFNVAPIGESAGYWQGYQQHAIAIAITVIALYFFLDQSIKMAKRTIDKGRSALPKWLVYVMFYLGGLSMFTVFQILFQSNMFDKIQISYFIVTLVIWLVLTIPLGIGSMMGKRRSYQS